MDIIIIKSGFQTIKSADLRPSSLKKGKNLCESGHVKDVEEMQLDDHSIIKGKVIRQTNLKSFYKVTITVSIYLF